MKRRLVVSSALFLCGIASAETAANVVSRPLPESPTLVETFVAQKLFTWQRRLRLQDWKVNVKLVHKTDLKPKTLGNVHWDTRAKTAVIRVMHPEDYDLPFAEILEDMEMTLVHELVHLHLSGLPRTDVSKPLEEQAVNLLAEALVGLDRRK